MDSHSWPATESADQSELHRHNSHFEVWESMQEAGQLSIESNGGKVGDLKTGFGRRKD
jgi:hypothetical protein